MDKIINIVFSGTGGFGIITASDICAQTAMQSGFDVKKADTKGIAKRGGFVLSSVRFGSKVFSPMVEKGAADFHININACHFDSLLSERGILINIPLEVIKKYGRHTNIFALGILSTRLPFDKSLWFKVIEKRFTDGVMAINIQIFLEGMKSCRFQESAV